MSQVDALLIQWWDRKREEIKSRLREFERIRGMGTKRVFEELCFCLLTPQSSALAADRAISHMVRTNALYEAPRELLAQIISGCGILYADNKSRYIVEARSKFMAEKPVLILAELLSDDAGKAREKVVTSIKGLGYKEASHFLRNIGYEGLAILDRHVLRTLADAGVIPEIPTTLSRKTYLQIEQEFLSYANRLNIPSDALDLVMWSCRTGQVFK